MIFSTPKTKRGLLMTKTEAKRERLLSRRIWKTRINYARAVGAAKIALQVFKKDSDDQQRVMDALADAEAILIEAISAEAQKAAA
jgi:hypothetical protein